MDPVELRNLTLRDILQGELKESFENEAKALQAADFVDAAYWRGLRVGMQRVLQALGAQ